MPTATTLERLASEAWATGLPLTAPLVATQRRRLDTCGVLPLAALAEVPAGQEVTVAGQLTILQRPPTARGMAFVTIEDETGLGNLVLTPDVDRRCRAALHAAPLLVVNGQVQRRGAVVHLHVMDVTPLWPADDALPEMDHQRSLRCPAPDHWSASAVT